MTVAASTPNSGIPNHVVFVLAAKAIGGYAWEKAGKVSASSLDRPERKRRRLFPTLAPFKHGRSRSGPEALPCTQSSITFCNSFTWAASGRSCRSKRMGTATQKFITREFTAPFEDGKPMVVLMLFSPGLYRPFFKYLLDTTVIHGDGTTTAAKKGDDNIGFSGHRK